MDENVKKTLEALKQNYIRSLPEKVEEIKSAWEEYLAEHDQSRLEETYRKAHSLAGSGATFDQIELGQKAKELELFIKEKIDNNEILLETTNSQVKAHISELFSLLEKNSTESKEQNQTPNIKVPNSIDSNHHANSMKILVVDDDKETRERHALLLEAVGHHVIQASDGNSAVELFNQKQPDLVLMDVIMPDCNGIDATKAIKSAAGGRFIPIVFVTSVNDLTELASFIDAGGDDFLVKPVEPLILNAKMQAFSRINQMYQKLNEYQIQTEVELETSKHLLNTLLSLDIHENENIQCWSASPGHFSGDLRLIKKLDDGEILILLCDFTGHGLPAAIGTIFVADLFRSMTRKSFNAQFILDEINEKMHQILPTGRYCAATMISYKPESSTVCIWNCGLPSVYLLDKENKITQKIESAHVPLGVLGGALRYPPKKFSTTDLQAVVLFSDGVTEAENPYGQMYSEDRLVSKIENVKPGASVFEQVKSDVEQFMDGSTPKDDISFVVLSF